MAALDGDGEEEEGEQRLECVVVIGQLRMLLNYDDDEGEQDVEMRWSSSTRLRESVRLARQPPAPEQSSNLRQPGRQRRTPPCSNNDPSRCYYSLRKRRQ